MRLGCLVTFVKLECTPAALVQAVPGHPAMQQALADPQFLRHHRDLVTGQNPFHRLTLELRRKSTLRLLFARLNTSDFHHKQGVHGMVAGRINFMIFYGITILKFVGGDSKEMEP